MAGTASTREVAAISRDRKDAAGESANVPVAVAGSRIEAELIAGMLRSHGVRAVVLADDAGGLEPQLQFEGVRVLVAPSDAASARELIDSDPDDTAW